VTSRILAITLLARDPAKLASFWSTALGWELRTEELGNVLVPTDETTFPIMFVATQNEKRARNRNHLDLTTTSREDQTATVLELLELGASHCDVGQGPEESHVVLADPEGNEFCVIDPANAFLADCPRLGAINCDGTKETGYFWSEVLGWPLIWDQNEETVIRDPSDTGPMITWSGPPLLPKHGNNRLQLSITPNEKSAAPDEVERLIGLGASRARSLENGILEMLDPDGNEFRVVLSQ
jgi:catechol 2,3-dioxygenase-like lactoylglutathione lyase family enzyme